MFTGIIEEVGEVREINPKGKAFRYRFFSPKLALGLRIGDSVSCNGICLTAEEVFTDGFYVTAVPETMSRTCLGSVTIGRLINFESAVRVGEPLGGHMVQGHVDGVAEVMAWTDLPAGAGKELSIQIPVAYSRYCIVKGSLCLHGVSLTIAGVDGNVLRFALVPHTLTHTNLEKVTVGERLNFEVDLIGKYVEKLMAHVV